MPQSQRSARKNLFPSKTAVERKADFIVHALGLAFLAPASVVLIARADGDAGLLASLVVYAGAALFSLCVSFAYHLLPRHDLRAVLRRWDHAAIYPVIAGVFGPLLVVCRTWSAFALLAVLWLLALAGAVFKLSGGNPDSKWSLFSYLGMGWFGMIALPDFWVGLPGVSLALLGVGGAFYTIGAAIYSRKQMPFRYPIWHTFGTCGGVAFFVSIWIATG